MRFIQRRGKTRREFPLACLSIFQRIPGGVRENPPRAQLSESASPGGVWGGVIGAPCAALPNAPKRRVVAARRASSLGVEGVGGATPTFEGFSPHILHERLKLKVHASHKHKTPTILNNSTLPAAFSLAPQAQRKPIAAAIPAADNPQKRNAEEFRRPRADAFWKRRAKTEKGDSKIFGRRRTKTETGLPSPLTAIEKSPFLPPVSRINFSDPLTFGPKSGTI